MILDLSKLTDNWQLDHPVERKKSHPVFLTEIIVIPMPTFHQPHLIGPRKSLCKSFNSVIDEIQIRDLVFRPALPIVLNFHFEKKLRDIFFLLTWQLNRQAH